MVGLVFDNILLTLKNDDGDTTNHHQPYQSKPNPEKPADPGKSKYTIVASIVGFFLGAAIGYFVSAGFMGIFITILCTVGGALVGTAIGSYLGNYMQKTAEDRRKEK